MNDKEKYLHELEREFKTTLKVLKSYPPDKLDFKPHERSRSAMDLIKTFIMEEKLVDKAMHGKMEERTPQPEETKLEELLVAYETSHNEMVKRMKDLPETEFNKTIKFPVAPKQIGDVKKIDFARLMMMDMVHHRGQFSVYLRMAGGSVPSIYGPSADEPWL
jgi:uncharacterized damage-inducible protein DinB